MPDLKSALLLITLWAAAAQAEVPKVVTDIPVVHSLASQVMGDLGAADLLVSGAADAHSYQLRPSQARALAAAEVIIWIGPEMTPWMERLLAAGTTAKIVGLLSAEGTLRRSYAEEAGNEHPQRGTDPHAWLDPGNARNWLGIIRDALTAADPENRATYARNTEMAQAAVATLAADLDNTLAMAKAAPIVVGHDAFGYFADRFGLTIAASIEAGDASPSGAAHLSDVAALLAETGVRCLFSEAGHDPRRAGVLVEGTGTRLGAPLDPEGRALDPGAALYDTLMRNLAQAVAECQAQG